MVHQLAGRACVLYDRVTGRVRHVHYSIALPESDDILSEAAIEKRAFELAARLRGLAQNKLGAIHVDPAALKPGCRHRVDVDSLTLVSEPLPYPRLVK
jgi:hypothetical protein